MRLWAFDYTNLSFYKYKDSKADFGFQTYYQVKFQPTNVVQTYQYLRTNLLSLLTGLGGLLYTLRSMSNGMVKKLSDFSVDNSMMRKLYSMDKDPSAPQKRYDDLDSKNQLQKTLGSRQAW